MNLSFCPLPSWTAYWTPPPAWPRRVFCENPWCALSACTDIRKSWLLVGFISLAYFIIMDSILFSQFRGANLSLTPSIQPGEVYTPFTHLSIKGLLNDHPSQFIIAPSTEYFNMLTHFSSTLSFIGPNMISFSHLICGFVAGKFMSSSVLQDRRIGVVLYQLRTWLDALDGTVFRSQKGLRLQYNSHHETIGYVIDSTFDTLGGTFLSFSIFFYLLKRFRPQQDNSLPLWNESGRDSSTSNITEPLNSVTRGKMDTCTISTAEHTYSIQLLFWKTLTFGLCLAVASKCWDKSVEDFVTIFENPLKDHGLSSLQFTLCHSYASVVLFYLWRLLGGQSMLNYALIAIYMDKTWVLISGLQWLLLLMVVVLYIITALYINYISHVLGLTL